MDVQLQEFEGGAGSSPNKNDEFNQSHGKKGQKKNKHGNEEVERRKKRALYGSRASSKIFEFGPPKQGNNVSSSVDVKENKSKDNDKDKTPSKSCKEHIIISSNSKWKAIFDVFVLLLVGYSCVTSMYYAAFSNSQTNILANFDLTVEGCFWLDLFLNFLQSYKDPETYEIITDFKLIAINYIFRGWFLVDFVSVFPFKLLMSQNGELTKLLRLFRLPRLIKLIDISRFHKLLKSLMSNSSGDEKIVRQYMLLYVYKILRLIIIAIIITYFIGCFWWYLCNSGLNEGNNFIKYNELDDKDEIM